MPNEVIQRHVVLATTLRAICYSPTSHGKLMCFWKKYVVCWLLCEWFLIDLLKLHHVGRGRGNETGTHLRTPLRFPDTWVCTLSSTIPKKNTYVVGVFFSESVSQLCSYLFYFSKFPFELVLKSSSSGSLYFPHPQHLNISTHCLVLPQILAKSQLAINFVPFLTLSSSVLTNISGVKLHLLAD